MTIASRIFLRNTEWTVEVEGSEEFVEKHVETYKAFFERQPAIRPDGATTPESRANQPPGPGAASDFDNVLALHNERVHVLKELPGASRADKMVAGALILAFANQSRGVVSVSFEEISELCESHGCLDRTNLSKSLKAERELFVFGGSRRKQTVSLTVPGRRRAEQMLRELNQVPG